MLLPYYPHGIAFRELRNIKSGEKKLIKVPFGGFYYFFFNQNSILQSYFYTSVLLIQCILQNDSCSSYWFKKKFLQARKMGGYDDAKSIGWNRRKCFFLSLMSRHILRASPKGFRKERIKCVSKCTKSSSWIIIFYYHFLVGVSTKSWNFFWWVESSFTFKLLLLC